MLPWILHRVSFVLKYFGKCILVCLDICPKQNFAYFVIESIDFPRSCDTFTVQNILFCVRFRKTALIHCLSFILAQKTRLKWYIYQEDNKVFERHHHYSSALLPFWLERKIQQSFEYMRYCIFGHTLVYERYACFFYRSHDGKCWQMAYYITKSKQSLTGISNDRFGILKKWSVNVAVNSITGVGLVMVGRMFDNCSTLAPPQYLNYTASAEGRFC